METYYSRRFFNINIYERNINEAIENCIDKALTNLSLPNETSSMRMGYV